MTHAPNPSPFKQKLLNLWQNKKINQVKNESQQYIPRKQKIKYINFLFFLHWYYSQNQGEAEISSIKS